MKVDPQEHKFAFQWLFGAGIFAILLSFGLMKIDDYLTNSKGEEELGATLRELRMAQTTLPSAVSDDRQLQDALYKSE